MTVNCPICGGPTEREIAEGFTSVPFGDNSRSVVGWRCPKCRSVSSGVVPVQPMRTSVQGCRVQNGPTEIYGLYKSAPAEDAPAASPTQPAT